MSSVKLNHVREFLTIAIQFNGVAVNHAFSLVLVNSIKEIVVGEEINIDQPVVGYIILFHLCYRLHVVVKDSDPVLVPDIFIHQEIRAYFSYNLKCHSPIIIPVGFRINDLLPFHQIASNQPTNQNKKQSLAKHKTLIFCLLKLKIAGKIAVFILPVMP